MILFFTSCILYFLLFITLSLSSSSFLLSFLPLVDFVLGTKGTPLLEQYDQWRAWADEKVCSDYSFHVAVTWWSEEVSKEMEILAKEKGMGLYGLLLSNSFFLSSLTPFAPFTGINSFKMFTAYKDVFMIRDDDVIALITCIYYHVCVLFTSRATIVYIRRSHSRCQPFNCNS